MIKVVFVCTGNICRSPMAQGLLREQARVMGRDDIVVSSMGIHGFDSQPATPLAVQVCQDNGIDISAHLSRPLVAEELVASDLILTMELVQKHFVTLFFPQVADRTFLLGTWPGPDNRKGNIRDPMGQAPKVYREVFEVIRRHVSRIAPDIAGLYGGAGQA